MSDASKPCKSSKDTCEYKYYSKFENSDTRSFTEPCSCGLNPEG